MYNFKLETNFGVFNFGEAEYTKKINCVADLSMGDGLVANLNKTNFAEVGSAVSSVAINGRNLEISGVIIEAEGETISQGKDHLRAVAVPGSTGTLSVSRESDTDGAPYYIQVYVESSPTFATGKDKGKFTLSLFAPYPFFTTYIEKIINRQETFSSIGSSCTEIPYGMYIELQQPTTSITITLNYSVLYENYSKKLEIADKFKTGDILEINRPYSRDTGLLGDFQVLKYNYNTSEEPKNIVDLSTDDSNFFWLPVNDECSFDAVNAAGEPIEARLNFADRVANVYDA